MGVGDTLLTWVGSRDPTWWNPRTGSDELGPILSLLESRRFSTMYLFFNIGGHSEEFTQRANATLRACQRLTPEMKVVHRPVTLMSVVDYREIFRVMNHECQRVLDLEGVRRRALYVYLSPGTPQMQTVWILLVQSGLLPARMIDAVPRDLLPPGTPNWREVDLSIPNFPQIVSPEEAERVVGILQSQVDNLTSENNRLRAEIELATVGQVVDEVQPGEGFNLRQHLIAHERVIYARALERSGGNAAKAARLIGVDPAAFRARAATLGIRKRRNQ